MECGGTTTQQWSDPITVPAPPPPHLLWDWTHGVVWELSATGGGLGGRRLAASTGRKGTHGLGVFSTMARMSMRGIIRTVAISRNGS